MLPIFRKRPRAISDRLKAFGTWICGAIFWLIEWAGDKIFGDAAFAWARNVVSPISHYEWIYIIWTYGVPISLVSLGVYFFWRAGLSRVAEQEVAIVPAASVRAQSSSITAQPSRPVMRRLCSRADSMELLSLVRSSHGAHVLSHWKPSGEDSTRIRVDAVRLDGSIDNRFGQDGAGFTSFALPNWPRTLARSLTYLSDASALVIGTGFDDGKKDSAGFAVKLNKAGVFDTQFGSGGVLIFPQDDSISYAQDSVQLNDHIFCVISTFESPIIKVVKLTLTGVIVGVTKIAIAGEGMAWPSRVIGTFPHNGLLIAGRIISRDSASADGFVVRLDANCALDQSFGAHGVVMLGKASALPLVHQVIDLIVLPTGTILVAGTGNEGFIVSLDSVGKPLPSFGRLGLYEAQATYRTTATSLAYARHLGIASLAGIESDGNSINRPFIGLIDSAGLNLLPEEHNPTVISLDAHSFNMKHLLLEDGQTFAAIQEGPLSHGRKSILVTTLALCQPPFVALIESSDVDQNNSSLSVRNSNPRA